MGKIWPCKDSWMHPSFSTPLPDPCFRTSFHLSHTAVSSLPSVFSLSCPGLTTTFSLKKLHSGVPILFLSSTLHWSSQKVNDSQMCHILQCFCVFLLIYLLFCIWPEAFPLFFYQSISTPIRSSTQMTTPYEIFASSPVPWEKLIPSPLHSITPVSYLYSKHCGTSISQIGIRVLWWYLKEEGKDPSNWKAWMSSPWKITYT